jgi:hypothetical protein
VSFCSFLTWRDFPIAEKLKNIIKKFLSPRMHARGIPAVSSILAFLAEILHLKLQYSRFNPKLVYNVLLSFEALRKICFFIN